MTQNGAVVVTEPATGWFKVGQLTEQAIASFGASPASLYLLLCKRVRYSGEGAGTTRVPYSPKEAARLFGCTPRHLYDCLRLLLEQKAVRVRRTQYGFDVAICGYPSRPTPAPQDSQIRAEQVCRSESPEGESLAEPEGIPEQVCRSGPEQVCRSLFLMQENQNQEGGSTTTVGDAAAPAAPPSVTPPCFHDAEETIQQAIVRGEHQRKERFSAEVKTALVHALGTVPEGLRSVAVAEAAVVIADHPDWNQDSPGTWAGQVKKAAQKRQLRSYRPPPPPPPEPEAPAGPVRIVSVDDIRAAIKHRRGPLKAAMEGVLAAAEVLA